MWRISVLVSDTRDRDAGSEERGRLVRPCV